MLGAGADGAQQCAAGHPVLAPAYGSQKRWHSSCVISTLAPGQISTCVTARGDCQWIVGMDDERSRCSRLRLELSEPHRSARTRREGSPTQRPAARGWRAMKLADAHPDDLIEVNKGGRRMVGRVLEVDVGVVVEAVLDMPEVAADRRVLTGPQQHELRALRQRVEDRVVDQVHALLGDRAGRRSRRPACTRHSARSVRAAPAC